MYRFLRITPEKVFGTFDATSTQGRFIRLDKPNLFTPMQKTAYVDVMDPLLNVPLNRFATKVNVGGKLTACVYAEDALVLLGLGCIRADDVPSTVPWVVTTPIVNDTVSATFEFAYSLQDGTLKRKRYLGVKGAKTRIYCSNDDDPRLMVDIDLIGKVPQGNSFDSSTDPDDTAFPEPAADGSDYGQTPYMIYDLALSVAASARGNIKSFEATFANKTRAYFDAKRFAQRISARGRVVTWTASTLEDAILASDRGHFDAATVLGAATATFTRGTKSVAIDFKANNFVNDLNEDFPMDEDGYFGGENQPFIDGGVDATMTIDIS